MIIWYIDFVILIFIYIDSIYMRIYNEKSRKTYK